MGRISFAIAEAALEAGAVLAAGVPVGAVHPGQGVELEDGTRIPSPVVVSNADPHRTLALLGDAAPAAFAGKVAAWRSTSATVKLNCALSRLPTFTAAPARSEHVYRAQVVISSGLDATQDAHRRAAAGEPAPEWCELYFHTAYDPSVAPAGAHTLSVFCQYVPYDLDWDGRRAEVAGAILATIARHAPDITDCVLEWELLAPPDVEARVGLTGGHIFQGECTPDQMWTRRFGARTGADGVYLCGAATHPAGSVIGINGRNAAMAILADR
jgi:phytoene dehydrogenase-like protein